MNKLLEWFLGPDYFTLHINRKTLLVLLIVGLVYASYKFGYSKAINDIRLFVTQMDKVAPQDSEHVPPTDGQPGKEPPNA